MIYISSGEKLDLLSSFVGVTSFSSISERYFCKSSLKVVVWKKKICKYTLNSFSLTITKKTPVVYIRGKLTNIFYFS